MSIFFEIVRSAIKSPLGRLYVSQEQSGDFMRHIPVEYPLRRGQKVTSQGRENPERDSPWLAMAGRRPPSWSRRGPVTHNLAVLTHNLAQKTGKEPWQTCETSHFFPRRSYASQSFLGEVMVHNLLNKSS